MESPQNTAEATWMAHLGKETSAREENEQAATDATRLKGYIVEVLSTHVRAGGTSQKRYRHRLVREEDGTVIIDTRKFYGKRQGRNMMKKAIDAQYELDERRREGSQPADPAGSDA